jgi:hypothetical protein
MRLGQHGNGEAGSSSDETHGTHEEKYSARDGIKDSSHDNIPQKRQQKSGQPRWYSTRGGKIAKDCWVN